MIRRLRILALLLPLALVSACTVNPATGRESFTAFMSREDELRIGAEEHPKLIKEFGGAYGDARLRAYVRRIGLELSRHAEVTDLPYTFTVLNDDKVNAFALPGGYVYVTRGLLALAENEAEMAAVLAHEIGHVVARHTAERYSATMATNLGLMVLGVIGSSAGVPSEVGRLVGMGAQAALMGYSRDQELEADMLGVRYMARAGYSPHAATSFLEKMQAHAELEQTLLGKQDGVAHNIMSTHPRTVDRVNQAIGLARTAPVASPELGRDAYLAEIDGMVFGDDPEQGVRRGRQFLHPGLGIAFTAPKDFQLFNSPRRVVGRGPEDSLMIFDMANEKTARRVRSMAEYLTGFWADNIHLRQVEAFNLNGMAAATGESRVTTRTGTRDIRLVAVDGGPGRIFRFAFVTPPQMTGRLNVELRRATYSFRRLDEAERAAVKPLKVRVVTVGPGDTPESLARRMPFEKFRRRWFEVLNGLRPGQGVQSGARVKIVAD